MDKLTERINRTGVTADVNSYLMWRGLADQAISDYRRPSSGIHSAISRGFAAIIPWKSIPLAHRAETGGTYTQAYSAKLGCEGIAYRNDSARFIGRAARRIGSRSKIRMRRPPGERLRKIGAIEPHSYWGQSQECQA